MLNRALHGRVSLEELSRFLIRRGYDNQSYPNREDDQANPFSPYAVKFSKNGKWHVRGKEEESPLCKEGKGKVPVELKHRFLVFSENWCVNCCWKMRDLEGLDRGALKDRFTEEILAAASRTKGVEEAFKLARYRLGIDYPGISNFGDWVIAIQNKHRKGILGQLYVTDPSAKESLEFARKWKKLTTK